MKKLILKWLFGTDDIKSYVELIESARESNERSIEAFKNALNANDQCRKTYDSHIETLNEYQKDIDTMRKLIRICENHGIDVDEEIKHITL